jgi:tetratricopeptide (TPR) repeat protein
MRLALAIVLCLATAAHAQAPGEAPLKVTLKVTVSLVDPAKPVPPSAPLFRPAVDLDQVLSIEGLKGPIRAEQEKLLGDLIAQTPDAHVEEKSDYYFRLGELTANQHRRWRLRSAELAAQADAPPSAKTKQEATAAAEKAKQYLTKAVKTFKALTDKEAFRNYPKMDVALFYLGYTLQAAGQMAEARSVYYKLIQSYPNSKYVPQAYLAFADHFFGAGDLANAETSYKQILKFPRSSAYWYAMYKVSLIHHGAQRFQEALETSFQVVQATKSDAGQESLNRAAASEFVRAYAEIGKPDKARPAFQRVDPKRATDMLQLLADLYLEQVKSDRAIYIYQELRKAEPAHPNACLWQYNVARATASIATAPQEVELCAADLPALQSWARASGVAVSCPTCGTKPRP